MLELILATCALALAHVIVGILFLMGFYKLADAIQKRSTTSVTPQHFSKQESFDKVREVETLPPEIVAPNFTKPPRPPGGFGSVDRQ